VVNSTGEWEDQGGKEETKEERLRKSDRTGFETSRGIWVQENCTLHDGQKEKRTEKSGGTGRIGGKKAYKVVAPQIMGEDAGGTHRIELYLQPAGGNGRNRTKEKGQGGKCGLVCNTQDGAFVE